MLLCLSHCPWPPTPWPPLLLVGERTCDWWRRGGCVVIALLPIHQRTWALYSASHLRRGQFLHLQTPLSRKIGRIRVSFASSADFFPPASSHTSLCGHFGFGLIPRLRSEKEVSPSVWLEFFWGEGSLRSLFIHLNQLGSFVGPKAWEHKSPKPLEKRKLW